MFKIGEFSKLVRVSARMLRYYDKQGLFSPAEVDRFTGYRLYSAKQVPFLMKIVALRDMGFGVEEMEEILPHYDNTHYMQKVLEKKREQINMIMQTEQLKLDQITAMSAKIQKENDKMVYEVEVKEIPAVQVLSLREIVPSFKDEVGQWEKMHAFIKENNVDCETSGYSIYHDVEHKEENIDIEIAFPVNTIGENHEGFIYKELESIPLSATIRFPGPYDNYNVAMQKLATWLEQNNYKIDGLIRGFGIIMPGFGVAIEDTLTELQVPIKKV